MTFSLLEKQEVIILARLFRWPYSNEYIICYDNRDPVMLAEFSFLVYIQIIQVITNVYSSVWKYDFEYFLSLGRLIEKKKKCILGTNILKVRGKF